MYLSELYVAINKIKWNSSTKKLWEMCGSPWMKTECNIHPEEREKSVSDILRYLGYLVTSETVPQIETNRHSPNEEEIH